jgi:hypothetical protein
MANVVPSCERRDDEVRDAEAELSGKAVNARYVHGTHAGIAVTEVAVLVVLAGAERRARLEDVRVNGDGAISPSMEARFGSVLMLVLPGTGGT